MQNRQRFFFILLIVLLFGIYCFFLGKNGLFVRLYLEENNAKLVKKIEILTAEQQRLEFQLDAQLNGKYLTKEAESLGYLYPQQKRIIFKNESYEQKNVSSLKNGVYIVGISILYWRILWGVFSITVLALYLVNIYRYRPEKSNSHSSIEE